MFSFVYSAGQSGSFRSALINRTHAKKIVNLSSRSDEYFISSSFWGTNRSSSTPQGRTVPPEGEPIQVRGPRHDELRGLGSLPGGLEEQVPAGDEDHLGCSLLHHLRNCTCHPFFDPKLCTVRSLVYRRRSSRPNTNQSINASFSLFRKQKKT